VQELKGETPVVPVFEAPKSPSEVISLRAWRLSRAREVLFLVMGTAKRKAFASLMAGSDISASRIASAGGVDVLVDEAAAGRCARFNRGHWGHLQLRSFVVSLSNREREPMRPYPVTRVSPTSPNAPPSRGTRRWITFPAAARCRMCAKRHKVTSTFAREIEL